MNNPADTTPKNLAQRFSTLPTKTKVATAATFFIVIIAAALAYHYSASTEVASAAAPTTAPGTFHPTKQQFDTLKIMPVQSISFKSEEITDGNIASNDDTTTQVFSPYSGHITKLFAKLGDAVVKGTPLMAVDASEFVQGQNDLVSAAAALKSAQAQFKLAQVAEQRQHELLNVKAGALKDWLQSQSDLATAEGTMRSAEIALAAVRNRLKILGKSDQEITALDAEPTGKNMTPEALVRSPIKGTVILRQVGLGQNIQSVAAGAANPVFAIADLSTVWLIANARETDTALIKIGAPLEVSVPAIPGRVFKAKVAWIAPSIDPNTHRLPVRAEIDNHDGALKPAMFANFRILIGATRTAPGVPQNAVVYEGADAHVFVADNNGNIMLRPIHVGRINDDLIEVVSGLAVGEKIVTSGALFIDRALENN